MGTSKLMAEKLTLNANEFSENKNFYCIRFGNVIGSRGSVLEVFKNQISNNYDLTVTEKNMTRFFMDIDHAANEVLKTLQMSRGGEIFVIKSMCSFKILDLANVMMRYYKKKLKETKIHNQSLHDLACNLLITD